MKTTSINEMLAHSELELYLKRIEQTIDHLERHITGARHAARQMDASLGFKDHIEQRLRQMAVQNEVAEFAVHWLRKDIKSPF